MTTDTDKEMPVPGNAPAADVAGVKSTGAEGAGGKDAAAEHRNRMITETRSKEMQQSMDALGEDVGELTPLEQDIIRAESESKEEAEATIALEQEKNRHAKALREAQKMVNQATPSRMLLERPAWGITGAVGELHMHSSWLLCIGRSASTGRGPVTGLYGFAAKVKQVLNDYRRGCPFAAMRLLKVEEELKVVNELFTAKQAELRTLLREKVRTQMEPFTSAKPAQAHLNFVSPYAYHAFELILLHDDVIRIIFPYIQMRLLDVRPYQESLREMGRHLRRLLGSCDGHFFVGMDSWNSKDDTCHVAINAFGEPNPDTIAGKLLPYLVTVPQTFVR